jgi:RNA-directed DNA polymerase
MIEVMASCSPAQWGLPCNRLCCAPIGAPQRGKPSSPTSNARTDGSCRVLESGVRGNPPAPFGRGERPQGPTYPYNVRKYKGKLLIKPSQKNVKAFLENIRKLVKDDKQAVAGHLIAQLNPKIRGWANYHHHIVSKETLAKVDHAIFMMVWQWAQRRHPKKSPTWIRKKYFHSIGADHWVFSGEVLGRDGAVHPIGLLKMRRISIERHTKLQSEANPYDPAWEMSFEKRLDVKTGHNLRGRRKLLTLWKQQQGLCPLCSRKITKLTGWQSHHIVWRSLGGGNE